MSSHGYAFFCIQDLREAKQQLAQKMDELEVERRTLEQERAQVQQQQQANGQHAEIEDYLREDSELADEKRNLSLPAAHAEEGAQVGVNCMLVTSSLWCITLVHVNHSISC